MENTIVTIFVILALIVGGVGGAVFTPNTTETQTVYQDKIVEKIVNVTVDKLVEIPAPDMLSLAVDAFLQAVEDEEDEAGHDVLLAELEDKDYYFDEMEVRSIDDDYTVTYDGDKIKVEFSIDLRFDDGDDRDKATYNVKVVFEEDEDTKVTLI